jgi:hypothetical protein
VIKLFSESLALIPIESCLEGDRQSNQKLARFKLIKTVGPDLSGFRSNMSGLGRICPVWRQKSRSRAKMVNLGPDKLTTCKLNTRELRENKGTTRNNLNTRNHT